MPEADKPNCPTCGKPLAVVRVIPAVAQWHELRTYKCNGCGYVDTVEIKDGKGASIGAR